METAREIEEKVNQELNNSMQAGYQIRLIVKLLEFYHMHEGISDGDLDIVSLTGILDKLAEEASDSADRGHYEARKLFLSKLKETPTKAASPLGVG